MAMQDAEELNNLFHNVSQEVETFTDKQLVWMQDTTSTSNQQIIFDNTSVMSRATIWKTAFIRIPFLWQASTLGKQIVVGGNTVTLDPYSPGASPLALKCGAASIFSGVQVNLSTGTGILNDQNSPFFLNQLRPKIEMNEEGMTTYGGEGGYAPDYFPEAAVPMGPLYYGGPGGIGNNIQKPAFGSSLSGVKINGVTIAQDYSVANTAIYNQANEIIQNPVVLKTVSGAASASNTFDANGLLVSSPSVTSGAMTATNGTYSFQLIPENFTFSSNALIAIQQPAVISITVASNAVTAESITFFGKGYGTDGTDGGVGLLPNLFIATLRTGAVNTAGGVLAGGGATFVFQVDYAIPGLVPHGIDPQFAGGYSDLSCKNPFYNEGFAKRIQSWWANTELVQSASSVPTGQPGYNAIYRTNVIVRMQNIHDFYRQLDFPIENTRLQTILTLAAPFNTSAAGSYFGMHYGPSVVANPPVFKIAQSSSGGVTTLKQGVTAGACTLYLNSVTFPAESAVRLKNALSNPTGGLIKQLSFLEGEITLLAANSKASTFTAQIQTTSTRVKRIWIAGFPTGSNATLGNFPNAGFTSQSLSIAQPFSGFIPTARVNGCVLRINGQPWRQNPLTNDWEFWDKVREHMVGFGEDDTIGSKVDYIQWLSGVAVMYVFDLQRQGVRPSINDPLLLGVDITRMQDLNVSPVTKWNTAGQNDLYSPVDWYCIIEKESLVQLNIGTANAAAIKQF